MNKTDRKIKNKIAKLRKRLQKYEKKEKSNHKDGFDQTQESESIILEDEPNSIPDFDPEIMLENEPPTEVPVLEMSDTEVENLDSDVLLALGEFNSGGKQYGEKFHEEISATIQNILTEGLSKQNKDNITESLLIPSNCTMLDAPKLNTELASILNNPSKTRDKLLQDRQQDLGLAIGSICTIINSLSKKDYDKLAIIEKLSDTSRLLSHLHSQYTEIRRKLVNPALYKNLAESLKENKRDQTYLFSNLEDSVKSFSAKKRASNVLRPKQTVPPKANTKNYHQTPRRLNPNQVHPVRGSFRGRAQVHHYQPYPRPPFKAQDNRQQPNRGRARYP